MPMGVREAVGGGLRAHAPAALALLAALLWMPQGARAQWTSSNGSTTTADNVRVGNHSAPVNNLDVRSDTAPVGVFVSGQGRALINFHDAAAPADSKLFQWRSEGGVFRMTSVNDAWSNYVSGNIIAATAAGNVGFGTAAPARQLNVHQSAGGAKGLLLSGDEFYQSGNGGADGVAILLGVNRPGNRQLWIGDSTAIGSATLGMVRYMTGTSLPYLDATTGDGLTRLNVGFATATTNALVGANDVSVVQPASKLSVMGNLSVGFNYPATAAPANGAIIEGNVGIGTAAPTERLHVNGNLKVTGNIEAKYQDVAEWVPTTQKLAAGTVVILDPSRTNHVLASGSAYDTSVAGVVSAQPGIILGEGGEGKVMVATTGRVRVRVDATKGPIKIGDLLVTSGVAGVAMRSEPMVVGGRRIHAPGTIIGKALEPLANGVGEILVLLSMQ